MGSFRNEPNGKMGSFRNEPNGGSASPIRPSALLCLLFLTVACPVRAQEELVVRPGPPPKEGFEVDLDKDGVPDGWYNLRDARLAGDGIDGPTCLRFECDRPGRPSRASRAFGIDGRQFEAVVIGLWVRIDDIRGGERMGEEPSLLIDFLGTELRTVGHGVLGPWTRSVPSRRWTWVAKRIPVPEATLDAILSIGLIGATGVLEVDGLTIDLVPRGGSETTDLVLNGGLELGDPSPAHWVVSGGAARVMPGHDSDSALELSRSGARGQAAVAVPVDRLDALEIRLWARGSGLRGSGGAVGEVFFLDEDGRVLPGAAAGARVFRWAGSFDWSSFLAVIRVPQAASRAVLQLEKTDSIGSIKFDDLTITASPDPSRGAWTPYHAMTDTDGWHPYQAAELIEPDSALDFAFLHDPPAGKHGLVTVQDGHLAFTKGGRARFFGVVLLPPTTIPTPERADAMAERLARRGINLVRFDKLDAPFGPGRSLIDDTADNTATLDPMMLDRFDHLIAALKQRGLYVSLELIASCRFRQGDAIAGGAALPPGGGPATAFDPAIRARTLKFAHALLDHVNPETGLALKDDPVLAWLSISGEQSLFDLIDNPEILPAESAAELRKLQERSTLGAGRRFWQSAESDQWQSIAKDLRDDGLRVPIAGCSHWRREPEFVAAQTAKGLDLIDDRLYWAPPLYALAERRSMVEHAEGSLASEASKKHKSDRPYVVSQWCSHTGGNWALPYEGADLLLGAEMAAAEGWDALVRRGVFLFPETWGAAAPGTSGGQDLFPIPEALNANPAVFAFLPHAASIILRPAAEPDHAARASRRRRVAWDPSEGRLAVITPHTQALALAGQLGRRPVVSDALTIATDTPGATVAVSSVGPEPIATARRLLVTALARVEPTGLTYADATGREVADPGRPPLRSRTGPRPRRVEPPRSHPGLRPRQRRPPQRSRDPRTDSHRRSPRDRRPLSRRPLRAGRRRRRRQIDRCSSPGPGPMVSVLPLSLCGESTCRSSHGSRESSEPMLTLVTGGAGFIGSHLVDRLLADGGDVVVLDNFDPFYAAPASESNLAAASANPRFRLVELDIRDAAGVDRLVGEVRPEAIVHLAARAGVRPSIEQPALYAEVNVTGTVHLAASRLPARTPPAVRLCLQLQRLWRPRHRPVPRDRPASITPSARTPPPRRRASCWPTPSTTSTACPSPACGSSPPTGPATAPTSPSPSSPT